MEYICAGKVLAKCWQSMCPTPVVDVRTAPLLAFVGFFIRICARDVRRLYDASIRIKRAFAAKIALKCPTTDIEKASFLDIVCTCDPMGICGLFSHRADIAADINVKPHPAWAGGTSATAHPTTMGA